MLISKSEYSVTEVALSKYETAHGFTFPQEYRAFLLKYNGEMCIRDRNLKW